MTPNDHKHLYNELTKVIYTRGHSMSNLTEAQTVFVKAMEQAAFGSDLFKCYAELINERPDVKLRNLHAFCIGFGLGLSGNVSELQLTKLFH